MAGEFRQQREGRGAGREGVAVRVVASREGAAIAGGAGPGEWRVARGGTSGKRREVEKSGSGGCKPLTPAERRATPR